MKDDPKQFFYHQTVIYLCKYIAFQILYIDLEIYKKYIEHIYMKHPVYKVETVMNIDIYDLHRTPCIHGRKYFYLGYV